MYLDQKLPTFSFISLLWSAWFHICCSDIVADPDQGVFNVELTC